MSKGSGHTAADSKMNSSKSQRGHLLIINYAMNSFHPIFSHQIGIVNRLAPNYETVEVITHEYMGEEVRSNVNIRHVAWDQSRNFKNSIIFLFFFLRLIIRKKPSAIFCHMTEVQSFLIAPISKMLGIPHYLWYAHRSKSKYLSFASVFINGVITSTTGSCPISGKKVFAIGQSVSPKDFPFTSRTSFPRNSIKAIHIGRIDPSKEIQKIIELVLSEPNRNKILELALIGDPTPGNEKFASRITQYSSSKESPYIHVERSIARTEIPKTLEKYDLFLHSYFGSLDKTLVEATMTGIPVVTINPEYILHVGRWDSSTNIPELSSELDAFLSLDSSSINAEIQKRLERVTRDHSLDNWISKLVAILNRK